MNGLDVPYAIRYKPMTLVNPLGDSDVVEALKYMH